MASRGATASYEPWFERWPELEEWEQKRFEDLGLPWSSTEDDRARGYLVVDSEVEYEGKRLPISVRYPSEYPELPPLVYSDPPVLARHQQPFQGNFCLLERPIDSWPGRDWGAADLIAERLTSLLRDSEAGEEVVRRGEAPMPEPFSAHYFYEPGTAVLVPGNLASPHGASGRFEVRPFQQLRCILSSVDGIAGDKELVELFPLSQGLAGRWKRIDAPPSVGPTGKELLAWVRTEHPDLLSKPPPPPPPRKRWRGRPSPPPLEVCALVFSEEREVDGAERDAWLFLGVKDGKKGFLLHSQVVSQEERQRRIPDLEGLSDKSALVLGLGSLGADVALHLARPGIGELRLLDFDRFEANNAVRHPLAVDSAGLEKIDAVGAACRRANPFCEVRIQPVCLGNLEPSPPVKVLEENIQGADMAFETTGLHQIEHLVGRVAWDNEVAMVSCWLTEGSWAGEVVRIVPGRTRCMTCFQTEQRSGERLAGDAAPENPIPVQGCSHPTVSGAGFDAAEIATLAARLGVQTLLRSASYPEPSWDHLVANFRRDLDDVEHPRVATEPLPPNEECERCGPAAG